MYVAYYICVYIFTYTYTVFMCICACVCVSIHRFIPAHIYVYVVNQWYDNLYIYRYTCILTVYNIISLSVITRSQSLSTLFKIRRTTMFPSNVIWIWAGGLRIEENSILSSHSLPWDSYQDCPMSLLKIHKTYFVYRKLHKIYFINIYKINKIIILIKLSETSFSSSSSSIPCIGLEACSGLRSTSRESPFMIGHFRNRFILYPRYDTHTFEYNDFIHLQWCFLHLIFFLFLTRMMCLWSCVDTSS